MLFLNTQSIFKWLPAFIAVALQIQVTYTSFGDYFGLRLNCADILLPFTGLYILYSLLSGQTMWPRWYSKWLPILALILCVSMTLALFNGYSYNGYWSSWALVNKYVGFFVVLSYAALGGWLATNAHIFDKFLRYFIAFFIITMVASFIAALSEAMLGVPLWISNFPWDGFMGNRNVFMVAMVWIMIALETRAYLQKTHNTPQLFPLWVEYAFWTIVPVFALFNASRTGWIVGGIILLASAIKNNQRFLKVILPALILGAVLTSLPYSVSHVRPLKDGRQMRFLMDAINQDIQYEGDKKRIIALEDGVELYQQSNPVLGSGLGAYKTYQVSKRGEFIDIMDCSALWLLVETGVLGLLSFSAFFLLSFYYVFKRGFFEQSGQHLIICFFLVAMIIMSMVHELLYTRFFWFILGIGLVRHYVGRKEKTFA